jgi:protein gp37
MADGTEISWTDATWNPVTGCMVKSLGCRNCYAMRLAATRLKHLPSREGLARVTKGGPVWTGDVRFNEEWLDQPLRWSRPRDIFVAAHSDLFYERVPDAWIDRVMAVMILAHQHRFQVLTKRPDRAVQYLSGGRTLYHRVLDAARPLRAQRPYLDHVGINDPAAGAFHRHIWIGASVERQQEADERRPHLAAIAAMGFNTWVSYEPALGPVDWSGWEFIRWAVSGGESGPEARPSHPDWHRDTRDWCASRSIPFHFKQWGEWTPGENVDRKTGIVRTALWFDSKWMFGNEDLTTTDHHIDDEPDLYRVGKKAAGAQLDGCEHKERPNA